MATQRCQARIHVDPCKGSSTLEHIQVALGLETVTGLFGTES